MTKSDSMLSPVAHDLLDRWQIINHEVVLVGKGKLHQIASMLTKLILR